MNDESEDKIVKINYFKNFGTKIVNSNKMIKIMNEIK
jgi:hypothetical protein